MRIEILLIVILSGVIFIALSSITAIIYGVIKKAKKEAKAKLELYTMISRDALKQPIVFLGDSITEFYRVGEIFCSKYIHNRGVSGDTTEGVLKRLDDHVIVMNPSKIFLMIGTNDLGKGKKVDEITIQIQMIIERLHQALPKTPIILWSLCPVNKKAITGSRLVVGKRKNKDIDIINRFLKAYATNHQLPFVDISEALKDEKGNLKQEYTLEGLHLSYEGYIVVTAYLEPYIQTETNI